MLIFTYAKSDSLNARSALTKKNLIKIILKMSESFELSEKVHERIKILQNEINRDLQAARSVENEGEEARFELESLFYIGLAGYIHFKM